MLAPHAPLTLAVASVLVAVSLGGCQQIPRPKPNSPRLKLEVSVVMDDSFAAKLASVDETFKADLEEQVKLNADVEDRFYATLSSEYSSRQPRPDYLMTVKLGDFDATIEKETKLADKQEGDKEEADAEKEEADAEKEVDTTEAGAKKDTDPKKEGDKADENTKRTNVINRWVGNLSCSAIVTLQRRQENGPALLVDRSKATVRVDIRRPDPSKSVTEAILVNAEGEGNAVQLPREQLLKAVESAMRKSLRPMVATIDRELMLHSSQGGPLEPAK